MLRIVRRLGLAAAAGFAAACGAPDSEEAREVNVFSARHYPADETVYAAFTDSTGIEVNVIEAPGDLLIERVRTAGDRSPADIIVTVDAGRLHRAEQAGLFQPAGDLGGALARAPSNLRHPDGDWFGFSVRARVIAYAPDRVDASDVATYEALADPRFRGRVCVRSSNNVYNQSLLAAMIAAEGVEAAEAWADGVVHNFARPPQGGDTDQIRAVAAGQCDVAIVNHYYYARLARSEDPADQDVADAVALSFPSLAGRGTHVNVSGAGMAAGAPHPEAAREFLAYLLSDEAQRIFAEGTSEFPAVEDAAYDNPVLSAYAPFAADTVNVVALGENAAEAQRIFDRVGWP
ncbi:Fe(3+) ABC transporter substrate-binding protein [Marinicauda salina]|uniref:Fe(3+) ABC transporter substrate-binding protein n=1 Tax=Marinicauda salina TaxID=2135793 RepID=A0A2U2BSV8_9PROT|nr:extracellular solute-binding protein [Marinicauda salina]PWE17087.1 Fe(3+) ABC transporter substrate-binding protein [Marinicauda salina]